MKTVFTILAIFASVSTFGLDWSPPFMLSRNDVAKWKFDGAFDIDSEGKIHHVFTQWMEDINDSQLWYVTDRSGALVHTNLTISTHKANRSTFLGITPDNMLHLIYEAKLSGAWAVFHRTKPVAGGTWSAPERCDVHGGNHIGTAMDASGGLYCVSLQLFQSGIANALYGRYKPLGGAWQAGHQVQGEIAGKWPANGWVGALNGGRFVISFSCDKPYYKFREPNGTFTSPVAVLGEGNIRMAQASTGELAMVYSRDDGTSTCQWDIMARFSTNMGQTWTEPYNVSNDAFFSIKQQLLYDDADMLHLMFINAGPGCSGSPRLTYASAYNNVWDTPVRILSPSGNVELRNGGLRARQDRLYVLFSDNRDHENNHASILGDMFMMVADLAPPLTPRPTATVTRTPTITLTPTRTLTPTVTPTRTFTNTPRPQSPTPTPSAHTNAHMLTW